MIRVLLADDEAMVRAGIRAILAADTGIDVVAEAGDGRQAITEAQRLRPDVALLDIRMPVLDGLAAAAELRRTLPDTRVAMLTTFLDDRYIGQALAQGAAGFLLKTGDPRELLLGVRAVADGAAYLSPRVAQRLIAQLDTGRLTAPAAARARLAGLTDREREVLALLGTGLSNAEIATRLHLVEGTVKGYVSAVLARTGSRNRVEAALLAHHAGLVSDPPHRG